jgi:hypothetical protein
MSDPQPRDLFDSSLREWIHSSIDRGPLLLVGPVGAGAEDLAAAELEHAHDGVLLQPTVGSTTEDLVASTVAQIVARIEPTGLDAFDGDTPRARRAGLELARRYGTDAPEALDIARGQSPDGWTLTDAVGARAAREAIPPMVVAITNAHRLAEPPLWDLRDLANKGVIRAAATTHREHVDRLFGPRGPLHGNATVVELPQLDPRAWAQRFPEPVHPADLEWLLARTRGRAASTLEVLSFRESKRSIRSAWARAVTARRPEAESVLNLASGVHVYGPHLLIAIANGQAPYGAIPNAPSQRVARALAKLRDMDLIEQPVPRTWQIADPILHGALLARTRVLITQHELATTHAAAAR